MSTTDLITNVNINVHTVTTVAGPQAGNSAIQARLRSFYEREGRLTPEQIDMRLEAVAKCPIPQPSNPGPSLPAWKYLPRREREEYLAAGFK